MQDDVTKFLQSMAGKPAPQAAPQAQGEEIWDKVIQPKASYLILGDVGTGKSGLAYWLMERYGQKYQLAPAVVGLPSNKLSLLPPHYKTLTTPDEVENQEHVIAFVDEADIQLGIENTKAREYVTNFLSLPRQRHQILLLAFHFPRLVLARYLPFFAAFLHKRPPYLIEFASKGKGDALYHMMLKAEERFAELTPPNWEGVGQPPAVLANTYVVAPRIRWQGLLQNPLASFWSQDLSEVWAGTDVAKGAALTSVRQTKQLPLVATDGTLVTDEMRERKVKIEDITTPEGQKAAYIDPFTNKQWIE